MVMRFGFDEELGAENYIASSEDAFYSEGNRKNISEKTQNLIDEKVRNILKSAYETARSILTKYHTLHITISDVLIQQEEMLQEDFDAYFTDIVVPPKVAM